MFPGQGAQHVRMAAGLHDRASGDPVFRRTVDEVLELFDDPDALRADWLAQRPAVPVDDVTRAQPLLFTVGYALGRMVLSRGVRPAALLGHSVGELVAATLAGVFEVSDAVAVMRDRVARLARTPPGGMLTVSAAEHQMLPFLQRHTEVTIGAINAPRQVALAGFDGPLSAVAADLAAEGFTARRVAARTAFHSRALSGLFDEPGPLRDAALHRPEIPLWSATAGRRLTSAEAIDPVLWSDQPVAPVLFWPALHDLLSSGCYLLTDTGPGQGLAMLARRHPRVQPGSSAVTTLLPAKPSTPQAERAAVARWLQDRSEQHDVSVPECEPGPARRTGGA